MRSLYSLLALSLAISPVLAMAQAGQAHSPGIGHTLFMRGMVVRADGARLVVCIGSADGAGPGQELVAYRVVEHPHGPKAPPIFQRKHVGTVRIDQIIDEHFANAIVLSGEIKRNDIVELRRN